MYNLSQVQEAITPGAQRPYLDAGIHDNIKLEAVRYDTSENGNKYIAFDFVDEQGAKLTHTEWKPTPRAGIDISSKVNTQMAKILQIIKLYLPAEKLNQNFNDFETFAAWVTKELNSVNITKPVRLKVVYNFSNTKNKDYATLPTYGKYAFIESMDVNPSGLRKLAIDRFERIAVPQQTPDQEKYAQPNPFTNGMPSGVGEPVSDDIPF